MDKISAFLTPARRKAAYATLAAAGALVVGLGYADEVQVAHWLNVAAQISTVLGLLMATVHTDTSKPSGMPEAPPANPTVQDLVDHALSQPMADTKADAAYHGRHAE